MLVSSLSLLEFKNLLFLEGLDNIARAAFIASKSFSSCFCVILSFIGSIGFGLKGISEFSFLSLISVSSNVFSNLFNAFFCTFDKKFSFWIKVLELSNSITGFLFSSFLPKVFTSELDSICFTVSSEILSSIVFFSSNFESSISLFLTVSLE